MGTTESILYSDDIEEEVEEPIPNVERPRMPQTKAPHRPPRTQVLLHGCVLGMSKSGKTSLLERFQGREPNPRSTDASRDEEQESIEIPYKAPLDAPTWHDRIRLHVHATKKVAVAKDDSYDFYILLIDPRKPPDKVHKYMSKTIRAMVQRQQQQHAPLCLCLLRSFRDIVTTTKDSSIIPSTDLTAWTLECLGQQDHTIAADRLILQQLDVSLVHCYGLAQLHQFIYQAYAQHHMEVLRRQWQQVRDAQRNIVQPQLPYDEFLQETRGERPQTATPQPQQRRAIIQTAPEPEVPVKSKAALEAFLESSDEEGEEEEEAEQTESVVATEATSVVEEDQISREDDTEVQSHEGTDEHISEEPLPVESSTQIQQTHPSNDECDEAEKSHQSPQQPSKEETTPCAAGEPTEDTSKPAIPNEPTKDTSTPAIPNVPTEDTSQPAIEDSFFADESDTESVAHAAPLQATKDASVDDADDDDDDDDDDAFFISHIDDKDQSSSTAHEDAIQVQGDIEEDAANAEALATTTQESANDPPKDYNPEIKAALEAAKEDFERMLKQKDSDRKKATKSKKKKDSEKRRKDPEKKKKRTTD